MSGADSVEVAQLVVDPHGVLVERVGVGAVPDRGVEDGECFFGLGGGEFGGEGTVGVERLLAGGFAVGFDPFVFAVLGQGAVGPRT